MRFLRWAIVVVVLIAAYPGWLAYQVWEQSREDEPHGADAIVVLGAAQYDGVPSPVFRARLDQAVHSYNDDLSDTIVVTGGKQEGDRVTEAESGEAYLISQGVPSDRILLETEGRTTFESLQEVREIANEHGIDTLLVVTDPLHSERVKRIAHDLGFTEVYASWASYQRLPRSRETKLRELLHEVGAILIYELLER